MRFLQSPVFYLVGSNVVFWGLPLLLIQLRSHTAAEAPPPPSPAPAAVAVAGLPPERDPLSLEANLPELPASSSPPVQSPLAAVGQDMPSLVERPVPASVPLPPEPPLNLMKDLKGAAGLGGVITLSSLKEPLMPIAARAERLRQRQSGDSLAALPRHWRDSVRQELPASASVSTAAVVRLPVPALKQRQEVPVIVNERGEGEALVSPEDPRVRRAVEGWAARQVASGPGTVQVYVVAAEPLTLSAD